MKPNVDVVDLIAGQELTTHPAPNKNGYMAYWPQAELLGYKITLETAGAIISELIGSGQIIPDRVYHIVDNAGTYEVYIAGVLQPDIILVNDTDPGSPTFGLPIIMEDPYLDSKDFSIWQSGIEYLEKGARWQNDVSGGGIRLTQEGDYFVGGSQFNLVFKPQFSSVIVTPDAVGRFTSGEQIVTADTAATDGMNRKLIKIKGAASAAISFTLNPTYPENVICAILTGGGSNKQSIILPPVGQTLSTGVSVSRVILGEIDFCFLLRLGTEWTVINRGDRWKYVGQVVYGGLPGPDRLAANGQTIQIADYPGVDEYLNKMVTEYGAASVLTVGAWATYRSKWARDATSIRVKDARGRYIRGLDLGANVDPRRSGVAAADGQIPGDWKLGQILAHSHSYNEPDLFSNPDGGGIADYVKTKNGTTGLTGGPENSVNDMGEPTFILI